MSPARRGLFITLEGGEGVGKSTLAKGLAGLIRDAGLGVFQTREPGGTPMAEAIRNVVLHPPGGQALTAMAAALLMNAARSDHIAQCIGPALARGDWVVCDRFADSTRVYQSVDAQVSDSMLKLMESEVLGDVRPDITFVLDAAPETLLARRDGRGEPADVFEQRDLDFHRQVRAGFLDIARDEADRCVVLDASLPADTILRMAAQLISTRFPERRKLL